MVHSQPSRFDHVLRDRAEREPESETFTFLGDRGGSEIMSNADADARARAIAARLARHCVPGDRALILLPPGLDYIAAFYGCLYAGVVAVPAYPPGLANLARSVERLEAIARDCAPKCVLAAEELVDQKDALLESADVLRRVAWIAGDSLSIEAAEDWSEPRYASDVPAFLQYTSGSTGRPKGVCISHENLLHNTEEMRKRLRGGPGDRHVGWLPPYHDMGLVAGILMVSQFGMTVTLMSPLTFVKRPMLWIETLSNVRATVTGGAPFGFDLAASKATEEQLETLDLSEVRVACIAAEPVRPSTIERFARVFGACGFKRRAFLPCYGLAESTLMTTGGPAEIEPVVARFDRTEFRSGRLAPTRDAEASVELVASGQPIGATQVRIMDAETRESRAPGELGEIWVRGPSVAAGYWRAPERSAETFGGVCAQAQASGRFLRTGDIGGFFDGELYVAGRIKDMVICNGENHYAEDLEGTIEACHPNLRPGCGCAMSIDDGERERLVVVYEVVSRRLVHHDVVTAIRQAVASQHGAEVHDIELIRARTIPKTTNTKIQRHACREAFLDGTLRTIHRWTHPRFQASAPLEAVAAGGAR